MTALNVQFIDRFNHQVLACQDEAFTLAFSLLGDESLASKVVQEAILLVYHTWNDGDHTLAIKILQGVILSCRRAKRSKPGGEKECIPGWNRLEHSEREALLLVDGLDKSYQHSALVLQCSERDVARIVSHGRRKLAAARASEWR